MRIVVGIYRQVNLSLRKTIYMSINDINLNVFKLRNQSANEKCSTLDHGVRKNIGKCKQSDGYQCGVLILLPIITSCDDKF